jgi:hypothetical protein
MRVMPVCKAGNLHIMLFQLLLDRQRREGSASILVTAAGREVWLTVRPVSGVALSFIDPCQSLVAQKGVYSSKFV